MAQGWAGVIIVGLAVFGANTAHPAKPTPLIAIETHSAATYIDVLIRTSGKTHATVAALPGNADRQVAPRVYVDLERSRLSPGWRIPEGLEDGRIRRIRVAQHNAQTVRIVIELQEPMSYKLTELAGVGSRFVLRLTGPMPTKPEGKLTRTLSRAYKVVLDPGHGGQDMGARSSSGVQEKDVVLAIAREAARLLETAGVTAILTRSDDTFLSLQERTTLANQHNADAFVSIHANYVPQKHVSGIETYYLNVASSRYAMRLAAVENNASEKEVSDLQLILADLSTKATTQESMRLAELVQKRLIHQARLSNAQAKNHGVKSALFYVLLGARMPSILVETAFLSNPQEARLLMRPAYQRALARAITDAVIEHLKTPVRIVNP